MLRLVLEGSGNKLINPQNKNKEKQEKEMKKGFFKKIWYSIYKIEKYSELSAEGFGKAIKYLVTLIIILSIASSSVSVYKTSKDIKEVSKYISESAPEFSYNDNILSVNSQEPIINESSTFGKIVIDTNTEEQKQINKYINDNEEQNLVIVLKDKLILKEAGLKRTDYNYKELFEELGITEFNKEKLVQYLTSSQVMPLYLNLFLILFIYAFILQFMNTLSYIIVISIVGYLATIILRLKIRYVAIFNMAIYSITLSTLLNILYIGINAFYDYIITYFDVMYILVASIYMISAIFILKSEFNRKQGEVQKIIEVEKQIKEEIKQNQREEKQKDNKEANKDTSKKEQQEDKEEGETPEGSNA